MEFPRQLALVSHSGSLRMRLLSVIQHQDHLSLRFEPGAEGTGWQDLTVSADDHRRLESWLQSIDGQHATSISWRPARLAWANLRVGRAKAGLCGIALWRWGPLPLPFIGFYRLRPEDLRKIGDALQSAT